MQAFALGLLFVYPGFEARGVDFLPALLHCAWAYGPALIVTGAVASEAVSRAVLALKNPPPPAPPDAADAEGGAAVTARPVDPHMWRAGTAFDATSRGGAAFALGVAHYALSCALTCASVPWGDFIGAAATELALSPDILGLETGARPLGLDGRGREAGSSWLCWRTHPLTPALFALACLCCVALIVARFALMARAVLALVESVGVEVRGGEEGGRTLLNVRTGASADSVLRAQLHPPPHPPPPAAVAIPQDRAAACGGGRGANGRGRGSRCAGRGAADDGGPLRRDQQARAA